MKSITLRLTLDVTYDLHGTPIDDLRDMLEAIVHNAALNGVISGETEAEVDVYSSRVDKIKRGAPTPDKMAKALAEALEWCEGDAEAGPDVTLDRACIEARLATLRRALGRK